MKPKGIFQLCNDKSHYSCKNYAIKTLLRNLNYRKIYKGLKTAEDEGKLSKDEIYFRTRWKNSKSWQKKAQMKPKSWNADIRANSPLALNKIIKKGLL